MKRAAWLTDIHLNFLGTQKRQEFLGSLTELAADALLIGGDIGEAPDLVPHLEQIGAAVSCPIHFVLGNHDFYFGSIERVRRQIRQFCQAYPRFTWLAEAKSIELAAGVGLVGHDGWADGRLGDYERSIVRMNDFRLIEELAHCGKQDRWGVLKALGDEAAAHVRAVLPAALDAYPRVILLTHVPPLREACWYQGQISDDQWLPHFTCQAMGQVLLEMMRRHPQRQLTVLCGHTHSGGECRPLDNLHVLTGSSEYGEPRVQRVFELGE